MERGDVARLFNVAEADVTSFDVSDAGVLAVLFGGVKRVASDDGIFGVNDCPQNRQLRRWAGDLPGSSDAEEPVAVEEPPDEPEPAPVAEAEPSAVPDGSAKDVMAWVDSDPERAEQAKTAELERDKPRSTLLTQLDGVLEP